MNPADRWSTGYTMLTGSGIYFDLMLPRAADVRISDIARGLSRIPRFNAHTRGRRPLSVAQHSVAVMRRVAANMGPMARMVALLHDAHEAYIGDITTPVARVLAERAGHDVVGDLKAQVQRAIHEALEVPVDVPEPLSLLVRTYDHEQLRTERDQYMPGRSRSLARVTWSAEEAEQRFLHAYEMLSQELA